MSYSFSAKGATKAAAKEAAESSIKNFVEPQTAHAGDIAAIRGACSAFIDSLPDPDEGEEVLLTCYGSCRTMPHGDAYRMDNTEMTVKATIVKAQG